MKTQLKPTYSSEGASERGAALMVALLFVVVLGGMASSLVVLNGSLHKEHKYLREETKSFYLAEAGLNEALGVLNHQGVTGFNAIAYPRDFDAGNYLVEATHGAVDPEIRLDYIRLRSVGDAGGEDIGAQLMAWDVPTGFFRWAVFGDQWVNLDSNVLIDSFDSNDGPYPAGVDWVNDYGNVGSNGDIWVDANTDVHGDVLAGPSGTLTEGAQTEIDGNSGSAEGLEDFPPITVPPIALTGSGSLNVNGNVTLPAGDYHYSSMTVHGNGVLTVQGPATMVLDDAAIESNAEWVIDATNGPVEIYATGDFDLRSNSEIITTTNQAIDVSILITSTNLPAPGATIALNSNAEFTGTIYAPNAEIDLDSNFEVFGAVKAGAVNIDSNTSLHFDEDLLYDDNVPHVYERGAWRRLSQQEVREVLLGL